MMTDIREEKIMIAQLRKWRKIKIGPKKLSQLLEAVGDLIRKTMGAMFANLSGELTKSTSARGYTCDKRDMMKSLTNVF